MVLPDAFGHRLDEYMLNKDGLAPGFLLTEEPFWR